MATPMVKAKGLYTSANRYDAPEGALVRASNVLILRDGIIRPRWPLQFSSTSIVASGGATVNYWHRMAELNGTMFLAGYNDANTSLAIGTAAMGSSFAGTTLFSYGEDTPSGVATHSTAPYFDTEFINTGRLLYNLRARGLFRIESSTVEKRAGGYPIAVSCFPRPFKVVAGNIAKAGTNTVTVTTPFAHGYVAGLKVTMTSAGEANFPTGEKTIVAVPTSTTFTYTEGAAATVTSANDQIFAANQLVGSSGFLATDKQVAYRALLVEYDDSGTKYVREASGRVVVTNASPFVGASANRNVQLAILLGISAVSANSVIELYRSVPADVAGDELQLVYRKYVTDTERSTGIAWVTDITPDGAMGKALYTNDSVETISRNNSTLPACKTFAKWGDRLVLANIVNIPSIEMQLKSTDTSAGGLVAGDVVNIGFGGSEYAFTAIASTAGFTDYKSFTVFTGGVATTDVRNTVLSFLDSLNWGAATPFSVSLVGMYTGKTGETGRFVLRQNYPTDQAEYGSATAMIRTVSAKITGTSTRDCFAPKLGAKCAVSSVVRGDGAAPGSSTTVVINTSSNHNFAVGEYVVWYSNWNNQTQGSVGGVAIEGAITAVTATSMTLTTASGSEATDSSGGVVALKYRPLIIGSRQKNLVMVSRPGESEAFHSKATTAVGSPDAHILKCVGLNDALLVFKEDGLFRVTASGTEGEALSSELLDASAILWAKDSVAVLRGKCYAWLTQGVSVISANGVEKVLSRHRIDDKLQPTQYSFAWRELSDPLNVYSRHATACADEWLGVYELRFMMNSGGLAFGPLKSDTNLTYCVDTDTWVEDDLQLCTSLVVPRTGMRHVITQTQYGYQPTETNYAGHVSTATTISGLGTYNSTTKTYPFTYTGTAPTTYSTVILNSGVAFTKVLSASGGSGTLFAPIELGSAFASATVVSPITCEIEWIPITMGATANLKTQQELLVLFGVQSQLLFSATTLTELSSAETNVVYNNTGFTTNSEGLNGYAPVTNRILVPTQHRVGQQIRLRLSIPTAAESWTILGIAGTAVKGGGRVNR